jgi:hypothetical protein
MTDRKQLTMIASFIPPLPPAEPHQSRPPSSFPLTSNPANLAPPATPHQPQFANTDTNGNPPVTPNPAPAVNEGDERYAGIEGVSVWEGEVGMNPAGEMDGSLQDRNSDTSSKERLIVRSEEGWDVVWKGELPIGMLRFFQTFCGIKIDKL